MKRKILSILAAMCVAVSLSACQAEDTGQSPPLSETVVSEPTQPLETTIQREIEQTSDLTFEDINIIEINGKLVSLPFKVEDLGEGYSYVEEQGNIKTYPAIYYNDQCLAFIDIDRDNNVTSISFPSDSLKKNNIKLCNLSFYDNYNKIINVLGRPSVQGTFLLIYEYEKGEVNFSLDDDTSTINVIKISLNGGTENE